MASRRTGEIDGRPRAADDELIRPLLERDGQASPLTELDSRLVQLLQNDGRRSLVQLSRDLGVTEKTVSRHLEALQADNTLRVAAIAAPDLLGYSAAAMLGITVTGQGSVSRVADALASHPRVDYVATSSGRYQVIAELVAPDDRALVQTVEDAVLAQPGVAGCESFPYLSVHHQQFDWLAAHRRQPPGDAPVRVPARFDELDLRIIAELAIDGRMPLGSVGDRVEVSESLVRKRLRAMLDAGAVRIMALAHPSIMGLDLVAWFGIRADPAVSLHEVAAALVRRSVVTFLVICGGRFELLAETVCADKSEVLSILDDEIRPTPGVASVELFTCTDVQFKSLRPRA